MARIVKLDNPLQHYDWGSHTAIAGFQGRSSPSPLPEAELWIGDHPQAPSSVVLDSGPRSLREWIASGAESVLGPEVLREYGDSLPFLVKLLAAELPLSVQVHPNADQAVAGFRREEAAGTPRDALERSYRDPNPKCEILIALTPFFGLAGFRSDEALAAQIHRCGNDVAERLLPRVAGVPDGHQAGELFLHLHELSAPDRDLLAAQLRRLGDPAAPPEDEAHWIARLCEIFPDDPLCAAPLLLNLVCLAPQEALVVTPGTVHAYLRGFGVEIMTASDNVIRGGLTTKFIDRAELAAIVQPGHSLPAITPEALEASGRSSYATQTAAFGVQGETVDGAATWARSPGWTSPQIVLCVQGNLELCRNGEGPRVSLRRGEAALIPASIEKYSVRGVGRLLRISTPGRSKTGRE